MVKSYKGDFMDFIKKIPAGNMMVPLLLAALIHTSFPDGIGFGEFSQALFSNGSVKVLMALNLMAAGSQIDFSNIGEVIKRAAVISLARISMGLILVFGISKLFGREGVFGLSLLALACGVLNHNNSVFISLNINYGDRIDQALAGFGSLITGPMLAMLVLGMGGLANIPFLAILDSAMPVILGIFIGHFIKGSREIFSTSQKMIIPFLGFSMGSAIDLRNVYRAGFSGLILAFVVIAIVGSFTVFADMKFNKRPGHTGWALATTGANAVAVPAMIAEIDPTWQAFVGLATAQVAASVVVTIILTPIITDFWAKRFKNK